MLTCYVLACVHIHTVIKEGLSLGSRHYPSLDNLVEVNSSGMLKYPCPPSRKYTALQSPLFLSHPISLSFPTSLDPSSLPLLPHPLPSFLLALITPCTKPLNLSSHSSIPQTNYGGGGKQTAKIISSSIKNLNEIGAFFLPLSTKLSHTSFFPLIFSFPF
jgi:hypothetical protein